MIIGVTGSYCAGKNTFCEKLNNIGIKSIDVDRVGHAALQAKQKILLAHFGNKILNSHDNSINRKALGNIVFAHKKQLIILESIVHPWIKEYIRVFIEDNRDTDIAINAALLFYLELETYCDIIVILKIPFFIRFFRALQRDSLGIFATFRRFIHQKPLPSNKILKNISNSVETKVVRNSNKIQSLVKDIGSITHGTIQQRTI